MSKATFAGRLARVGLATAIGMFAVAVVLVRPAAAQQTPTPTPQQPADDSACTPIVPVCTDDARKAIDTLIPGLPVARKAADVVGGSFSGMAQEVAQATIGWYTQTLVAGASAVLGELSGFVDATTHPRVTAAAFIQPGGAYHTVASLSLMLLVGFVFLGVIQGLTAGEPGQAMFRLLRDIPIAVLAILGFPWLVDQLLTAADGLAAAILPSGETAKQLLTNQLLETVKLAVGGGIAGLLIGLVAFAALILVYLELVVRDVLIYLVVGLAALSYAAFVWPVARGAARKVAEFAAAAILAKPAIFLALRIGLDLTSSHAEAAPWKGAPWGRLLVGLAVVCVAAFTPWVLWRLLPHAEAMAVSQGLGRGPARAAMQGLQTAYWVEAIRGQVGLGRAGRSGGATAGPEPASPGPVRGLPEVDRPGRAPAGMSMAGSGAAGKGATPTAGAGGSGAAAGGAAGGAAVAGPAGAAVAGIAAGVRAGKAGRDRVIGSVERDAAAAPSASPASDQTPPSGASPRGPAHTRGPGEAETPPQLSSPAPPATRDEQDWTRRRPHGRRDSSQ